MQTCRTCGRTFATYPILDGVRTDLHGRQQCLGCRPLRRLRAPRKILVRDRRAKVCEACGAAFPGKAVIDGKLRWLYGRRFCLLCSPFGAHNTSTSPPGRMDLAQLVQTRRRRRNAKTYRSLKKRRLRRKAELIAAQGGRCLDCGYVGSTAVFDFHHRDPSTKDFALAEFSGSLHRLLLEAQKCDVLCANCHRVRHATLEASLPADPVTTYRRRRKLRAIAYMGPS